MFRSSVHALEQKTFFATVSNLLYDICILENLEERTLIEGQFSNILFLSIPIEIIQKKIKIKQDYECVINKHILDVHCVKLHNYVHWLSILLYQEKKFILNQTHVILEVFFSVFQNMTKSLNCQILFQKMNALKVQCTSILSCPRRKSKERKKKN